MEHNTRPAPDSDLEAYGDWVTVDSAAPPAAAVRQPPAATADVEIAAELTDAEEEFLGRVSDADHAAAATVARDAGHPVHNGNGNGGANGSGEAEPGVGHPLPHAGGPAVAHPPAAAFADDPVRSLGGARGPARADQTPPSDRLARAAGAAASAAGSGRVGGEITASAVPEPLPAVAPAPLPAVAAVPPVQPAAVPAEAPAAAPANTAADLPAPPMETASEAGGGQPANLERRVAALEGRVAALAAAIGAGAAGADRSQGGGDAGQVHVSIEELDSEPAAEDSGPAALAADAAYAAAGSDSQPAPPIRLVPIADEEDEHAGQASAEGEGKALAGATVAAGESPPEAPPAPSDDSFRNDVREVLGYLDQLLDDLPRERIREFAQSSHFATYKALFTELGLDE